VLQASDKDGEVGERLRRRQVAQRLGRLVRVVAERLRLPVEPMLHINHCSKPLQKGNCIVQSACVMLDQCGVFSDGFFLQFLVSDTAMLTSGKGRVSCVRFG